MSPKTYLAWGALALTCALPAGAAAQFSEAPTALECEAMRCREVLPGAVRFEEVEGAPYEAGYDADGELIGWVALSVEVVDIPAYSGKPLVTLVSLTREGLIAGVRVVHHSEPILLVGIPFSALVDFVGNYRGQRPEARIVVGHASDPDAVEVDSISGATVTALAQNRTILDVARRVAAATGVIDATQLRRGHFIAEETPWDWPRMRAAGVFGHLRVTEREMGFEGSDEIFVDLYFTIADAPQIGRALMGGPTYEHQMALLEPGEHLFVILGNGTNSFKGSAFVRGGIFDRVRVDQELTQLVFRDTDYRNLSPVRIDGAPHFREGAIYITRGAHLDPGTPFDLVFLGSRYDGRGAFTREFREFRGTHQLPATVYQVDESDDEPIWVQAWRNRRVDAVLLGIFLLLVLGVFVLRKWSTASERLLERLHLASMLIAVVLLGVTMSAQPSVTQVLTLVDSLIHEWRFELFASEPLIFILWIFIFLTTLYWGRGVFCGWVCPYGALTELIFKAGQLLKLRPRELPDKLHRVARNLRYVMLFGLVPIFLYSAELGERLAEVEPFKSTFLVPIHTRHWGFILYWVVLLGLSLFTFRPFCRYLCPLGAGLALLSSFRPSGPKRRQFCSSCRICAKGCEPKAIREDGTINPRECLSCMECEATYRNDERCPPLIGIARLTRKTSLDETAKKKLAKLQAGQEDV